MYQFHRFDGHFIGVGLKVGGLYLGRPCTGKRPGDDGLVFFIQQAADQRPQAKLLFPATKVVRLTTADRKTTYELTRDFTVGDDGVISLPEGSRIPFKTLEQLYPLMTSSEPKIRGYRGGESRGTQGECELAHDDIHPSGCAWPAPSGRASGTSQTRKSAAVWRSDCGPEDIRAADALR